MLLAIGNTLNEADLQQALRNHEQAGRADAIKISTKLFSEDDLSGSKICGKFVGKAAQLSTFQVNY